MPDYFTLDELRALPDLGDVSRHPDERCEAAAAYIVGIIEREVGTSFVARTVVDERHDGGGTRIVLDAVYVRDVTAVTVDGSTLPIGEIVEKDGTVYHIVAGAKQRFSDGYQNVLVTYEAGYSDAPPPDIKEAALKGTRAHLIATASNSAIDDRRMSLNTEAGVVQFAIAGEDRPTGYPEVDATILAWRDTEPGFA